MDLSEIVLAAIAAVVAGGVVLKIVSSKRKTNRVNFVSQKGNSAGRDIVGGDSNSRNTKD